MLTSAFYGCVHWSYTTALVILDGREREKELEEDREREADA